MREVVTRTLVDAQAIEPWIDPASWSSGGERGWIRTSPEIALKRALCAGAGSIFEIATVARVGECGAQHLPEFHLLEWYRVEGTLDDVMRDVEVVVAAIWRALRSVVERAAPSDASALPPALTHPFAVIDFHTGFERSTGISLPAQVWSDPWSADAKARDATLVAGLDAVMSILLEFRARAGLRTTDAAPIVSVDEQAVKASRGDPSLQLLEAWTELFSLWSDLAWEPWLAREHAASPERIGVHLVDFPPALAALSRVVDTPLGPRARRVETYVGTREISNGYDELRDPRQQRERFAAVNRQRIRAGQPALPLPDAFLRDLVRPGLPRCAGIALGLERVLALGLGLPSLHELVFM
jgi:lysyl-tRNA synthetase class 2